MDGSDPEKQLGYYKQKRILQAMVKELIEKNVPVTFEKLLSLVQMNTGLGKKKAKEYLEMFHDSDFIRINTDNHMVELTKQGEDVNGPN